jgi:hypothetical protein
MLWANPFQALLRRRPPAPEPVGCVGVRRGPVPGDVQAHEATCLPAHQNAATGKPAIVKAYVPQTLSCREHRGFDLLVMHAGLPQCYTCHYRLKSAHTCELGAVNKPSLCPRMRARVRVAVRVGRQREGAGDGAEPAAGWRGECEAEMAAGRAEQGACGGA